MTTKTLGMAISERLEAMATDAVQLDELDAATMNSYEKKAREQQKAIAARPGPRSKLNKALHDRREKGLKTSSNLRSKQYTNEFDAHSKKSHKAFTQAAHEALTEHGYEVAKVGKASNIYTKYEPETNSLHAAKHHIGSPSTSDSRHYAEGGIQIVSTNGTTSKIDHSSFTMGLMRKKGASTHEEYVDEHKSKIKDELKRHHDWHTNNAFHRHMNEETGDVEQIDELSDKVKTSYAAKAKTSAGDLATKADILAAGSHRLRAAGHGEDASFVAKIASKTGAKADRRAATAEKIAPTKVVKEDTLEEGRGRPRKDGSSAVGADREHIVMQLRKHVSLRGAKPIEFADGSKHHITDGQARLALIMHNGLDTSGAKEQFMKKLDHSHTSFQDALKNKETAGKPPAEKSRITLPAIDRLNAKLGPEK